MKIYDLSPEISEHMVVYKNKAEKKPRLKVTRTIKEGANESRIEIDLHTGSHVDAPYHFLQNGKTINKIRLDRFMGMAVVLDFTKTKLQNSITKSHFRNKKVQKNDIVLIKTKNKAEKIFKSDVTYLENTGAEYLASKKIKAVGIDSLGIEKSQPNHETHKILLSKGIVIFEGLDLSRVKQGRYYFYGLPLKIRNGDASPVRAVLVKK